MRNFSNYFIVLAILFISSCATQTDPQDNAEVASNNNEAGTESSTSGNDPDELICRREIVSGTNFRRRVCMTRADRNRERNDSQEEMLERRSSIR